MSARPHPGNERRRWMLDALAGPDVRRPWLLDVEIGWYVFSAAEVVVQTARAAAADGTPRLPDDTLGWALAALPWVLAVLSALARWWRPMWTGGLAVAGLVACTAPAVLQDVVRPWSHLWLAPVVGVLPVLLAAAFHRGRWRALVPAAVVALVAGISLLAVRVSVPGMDRGLSGSLAVPLDQVGAAVVLVVVPVGVGLALRLADHRRRAAELNRIRTAERLQVARELHDLVAGHVAGITMVAQGVGARSDSAELRGLAGSIEASGHDALAAMHRMVGALRSDAGPGGTAGLATTATDVTGATTSALGEDHGARVRIDPAAAGATVPPDLLTTLHRVVGESLANVRRHAPGAGEVTVEVRVPDGDILVVEVVNDGAGRPGAVRRDGGGYGLVGLTERVTAVGGGLRAGPDGLGRWRVRAELPLVDRLPAVEGTGAAAPTGRTRRRPWDLRLGAAPR